MDATPVLVRSRLWQRNVQNRASQSLASASTIQAVDLDQEALEVIPDRIAELQFVKCWGSSEL